MDRRPLLPCRLTDLCPYLSTAVHMNILLKKCIYQSLQSISFVICLQTLWIVMICFQFCNRVKGFGQPIFYFRNCNIQISAFFFSLNLINDKILCLKCCFYGREEGINKRIVSVFLNLHCSDIRETEKRKTELEFGQRTKCTKWPTSCHISKYLTFLLE